MISPQAMGPEGRGIRKGEKMSVKSPLFSKKYLLKKAHGHEKYPNSMGYTRKFSKENRKDTRKNLGTLRRKKKHKQKHVKILCFS